MGGGGVSWNENIYLWNSIPRVYIIFIIYIHHYSCLLSLLLCICFGWAIYTVLKLFLSHEICAHVWHSINVCMWTHTHGMSHTCTHFDLCSWQGVPWDEVTQAKPIHHCQRWDTNYECLQWANISCSLSSSPPLSLPPPSISLTLSLPFSLLPPLSPFFRGKWCRKNWVHQVHSQVSSELALNRAITISCWPLFKSTHTMYICVAISLGSGFIPTGRVIYHLVEFSSGPSAISVTV